MCLHIGVSVCNIYKPWFHFLVNSIVIPYPLSLPFITLRIRSNGVFQLLYILLMLIGEQLYEGIIRLMCERMYVQYV
jgi:hypothetical protein